MKRVAAILVVLVQFALGASDDTVVSGRVLDFVSRKGIDGATVEAKIAGAEPRETVSGQDGTFEFPMVPRGKVIRIQVRQLGYSPDPFTKPITAKGPKVTLVVRLIPRLASDEYFRMAAREVFNDMAQSAELLDLLAASSISPEQYGLIYEELVQLSGSEGSKTRSHSLSVVLARLGAERDRADRGVVASSRGGAIREIAGIVTEGPYGLDATLERLGFSSGSAPAEWDTFPVVRRLEFAYAAAEKASRGGGTQLLILLAQDLKGRYDSVGYEPSLKALLIRTVKPPLSFQETDLPPPSALILPGSARAVIAAISRYHEYGPMGGVQGILEHSFDLPSPTAYEILRKAGTPEEALAIGLASVPERERDHALQKVVARLDQTDEVARAEVNLDEYRRYTKSEINLNEMTEPVSVGENRAAPSGGPPDIAGERYVRFVNTNYPADSGRTFSSMVGIAEGFGGVVLGNRVISPGLSRPVQLIWIPHRSDQATTGEIRIRFADGAERFYGPVDAEDVYAAAAMLRGVEGLRPYVKGEGVGLVSLNQRDQSPRFLADNRVVWEGRWDITLHPALARLRLGRSVLLCDAIPINRERLIHLVEANRGKARAGVLANLFTEDLFNWKFTDAPLQITVSGNRIEIMRAYDAAHPRSVDYRRRTFLSMKGFEEGDKASKDFTSRLDEFMPDLILSSQHYQRLNDFAALFALYRWGYSQNALFLNDPSVPSPLDPMPPSLILTETGQFDLASYSTEADVLRHFYREGEQRFEAIAANFPPALRTIAAQAAGSRREIQDQQIRLAELEEQLENVRLDFHALALRLEEKLPHAKRDEQLEKVQELLDRVENEIREYSHDGNMDVGGRDVTAQLSAFAAKIDPAFERQLRPVLDEYSRATAQLRSLERRADDTQMALHNRVLMALTGDGTYYGSQYQRIKTAYGDAISELAKAEKYEKSERERWEKDPARSGSELVEALVETELMNTARAEFLRSDSVEDRRGLAAIESEIEKGIAAATPPYGQSIRLTNAALAKSADARKAFADLLSRRNADLTKRYPDWRTWWALITCARHPSTVHLDFDMAIGE